MSADALDVDRARRDGASDLQLRVVQMRNDESSWRVIARALGVSVRTAREAWGAVNLVQRGGLEPTRRPATREDPTIGNEERLRGLPATGFGGAIRGTRPGDRPPARERPARAAKRGVGVIDDATARAVGHDIGATARLRDALRRRGYTAPTQGAGRPARARVDRRARYAHDMAVEQTTTLTCDTCGATQDIATTPGGSLDSPAGWVILAWVPRYDQRLCFDSVACIGGYPWGVPFVSPSSPPADDPGPAPAAPVPADGDTPAPVIADDTPPSGGDMITTEDAPAADDGAPAEDTLDPDTEGAEQPDGPSAGA